MLIMQQNGADSDNDDDDDNDDDTSGGTDNNACDQDRISLPNLNPMWSCGISVTRSFTCAAGIALLLYRPHAPTPLPQAPFSPSFPALPFDPNPLVIPTFFFTACPALC